MASWKDIETAAPELAAKAKVAFDAHKHKVMATIRADGSPRISGTELDFMANDAWIGSMPGAMKARDLLRDPRIAIHSAPVDLTLQTPDAKIAGRAIEVGDAERNEWVAARNEPVPEGAFHLFRLDVTEVVCTTVDGDALKIESWREGAGVDVTRRT